MPGSVSPLTFVITSTSLHSVCSTRSARDRHYACSPNQKQHLSPSDCHAEGNEQATDRRPRAPFTTIYVLAWAADCTLTLVGSGDGLHGPCG